MADNYQDVLLQIKSHGLIVKGDHLIPGKIQRCKVEGEGSEQRGWYVVHEIYIKGQPMLVGSYGIWHGASNNAIKIDLDKDLIVSTEERKQISALMAADRRRAKAAKEAEDKRASQASEKRWHECLPTPPGGVNDYLSRKQVSAHGVRFTPENQIVIPIRDHTGLIHCLQFILDRTNDKEKITKYKGRDKELWPPGCSKKSHYHMIGGIPRGIILIVEGYATGASVFEATGLPTVIAFDANNIAPVVEVLLKEYPNDNLLICADDDDLGQCQNQDCKKPVIVSESSDCPACGKPHGRTNAGVEAAIRTCISPRVNWIAPKFPDNEARLAHYKSRKGKLTDFNDLHCQDGLTTVKNQIEKAINALFDKRSGLQSGGNITQGDGGGGSHLIPPIDTTEELLDRFSLVYGKGGMVFDGYKHALIALSDMRDLCRSRETVRRWMEDANRKIVDPEAVGFDPSGQDEKIKCNLWGGWPVEPKEGGCDTLLELFHHMCSGESNADELYEWGLKWHAYPIQHPGAKMQTAMVIHGPQGTGKNVWTEAVKKIYGQHGDVIDQNTVENKHNDFLNNKLYLIADEVVARTDRYHIKNLLKGLVTSDSIVINPKNMAMYKVKNHTNIVFLSNERLPLVIEEDDRRHFVLWTPPPQPPNFYKTVSQEIKNGGIEALHHYLLHLDLGDFNEHTKPPMTGAKQDLINLSKENIVIFYEEWMSGELEDIPRVPALREDIFRLFSLWCGRNGTRAGALKHVMDKFGTLPGVERSVHRYQNGSKTPMQTFFFVPKCKEADPGQSQAFFLGDCVREFKDAIADYSATGK